MIEGVSESFENVWFSDKWHLIGMKNDISYYIERRLVVSGFVLGNSDDEVQRIGEKICDFLGAEIQ